MSINPGFYLFLPISQPGSLDFCQFWGSLDIPPVSSPLLYLVKVCFFWPSKTPPLVFGTTDNGTEKSPPVPLLRLSTPLLWALPTPHQKWPQRPSPRKSLKLNLIILYPPGDHQDPSHYLRHRKRVPASQAIPQWSNSHTALGISWCDSSCQPFPTSRFSQHASQTHAWSAAKPHYP